MAHSILGKFKSVLKSHEPAKEAVIAAPANGKLIPLKEVPDDVFAEEMLGCGFAVVPSDGKVVSPVDGEIVDIFDAKHAVTILSSDGKEILVHMGINTVEMNGAPFQILVDRNQRISAGMPIAKMDLKQVEDSGRDTSICVVFTNAETKTVILERPGVVTAGADGIVRLAEKD